MLIKVITNIIIEVEDDAQAEEASSLLDHGLEREMRDFPHGEIVATDVDHWEAVSAEEADREGWSE